MQLKTKQELIDEWRKEYYTDDETDEQIWKEATNVSHLYGDLDEEWYNILNCKFKEIYHCWFIDENMLKQLTNHIQKNISCKTEDIPFYMAKIIHNELKDTEKGIKWLEAIDMTEECFFGQQCY